MNNIEIRFFLCSFSLLILLCSTDLTGLHYLRTFNCSTLDGYIPQGPYLFSHHWPFPLITIKYHRKFSKGLCYNDGSLYFTLNNDKFCAGRYIDGHAELFCQLENNEYCWLNMQTSDGSQLNCDTSI